MTKNNVECITTLDDHIDNTCAVVETWPAPKELTLFEALKVFNMDEAQARLETSRRQMQILKERAKTPIVAVVGSLNGGKSSCVASFLSEAGRRRILCGLGHESGTHRFVFWLPPAWRECDFWPSFQDLLVSTFGTKPELLSDDPEKAHQQYNDYSSTKIALRPLVAFDDALEKFCLLDCLDVESKIGTQTAQERSDCLRKAAGLMHGIVFLADVSKLRAEVISDLANLFSFDSKRKIEQFLLINKVRIDEGPLTEQMKSAFDIREKISPCRLFAAYNFDSIANEKAEALPKAAAKEVGIPEGCPCFFEVCEGDDKENRGSRIAPNRLLMRHLQNIDAEALWEDALKKSHEAFCAELATVQRLLQAEVTRQRKDIDTAHARLVNFILNYVTENGNIKTPFTAKVMENIFKSLERTAPWYAKLSMKVAHPLNCLKGRSQKQQAMEMKLREVGITPEVFARQSVREMLASKGTNISETAYQRAWEEAFRAFHFQDEQEQDVIRKMDQAALEVWKIIPMGKKILTSMFLPVVALLGVVSVAFTIIDPTGTVSFVVFSVSVNQLLAMLGFGGLVTSGVASVMAMKAFDKMLKLHMAVPMLSRMIAYSCDVFGLPRNPNGSITYEFKDLGVVSLDAPANTECKAIVARLTTSKCYHLGTLETFLP